MNGIIAVKNYSGMNIVEELKRISGDMRIEKLEFFCIHYPEGQRPDMLKCGPMTTSDILRRKLPQQHQLNERDYFYFLAEVPDLARGGQEEL